MPAINIIGGGLAGCEAAMQAAQAGVKVKLWEMRPVKTTPVHRTSLLAELVCSNSLKSDLPDTAQGLLKQEMSCLGSLILACAYQSRVPAGSALAVDPRLFSSLITSQIEATPNIEIIRAEATQIIPGEPTIVASGPLTSDKLAVELRHYSGADNLFFYDAVAPSVTLASLNMDKIFKASRYGKGEDDYLNCPMSKDEYEEFYKQLISADVAEGHTIDQKEFFSSCMPIEVIGSRGVDTLRFGPMRPVGLRDPRTGKRAWAVVQLRQENQEGTVYGLVGFQTRLKWGSQDRIFRLIPGLENTEFVRYGVMHRNSYLNSPQILKPTLQHRRIPELFFAGQLTGVEGYMESAATGIWAGINAARLVNGQPLVTLSPYTMLGALINFITDHTQVNFQPMNANFGILPALENPARDKKQRYRQYVERSMQAMVSLTEGWQQ